MPTREARRKHVTEFASWWAASDTGHISLGRALRVCDEAETAAKAAKTSRDAISERRPVDMDRVAEAERDVHQAWRRWQAARDDLIVLRGGAPKNPGAVDRVADREYRGQVLPYIDETQHPSLRFDNTPFVSQMRLPNGPCEACDGNGLVSRLDGGVTRWSACEVCDGYGRAERR